MDEFVAPLPDPTIARDLPAPTFPAPSLAPPEVPAALPPPPAPVDATVALRPVADSGPRSRRPLAIALALITVAAAGLAAVAISRTNGEGSLTDTTPDIVTDAEVDTAFSFASAASAANTAGSMQFEMTSTTPDGVVTMVATIDRASQRIAAEVDMSQLTVENGFFETPDTAAMILDESTRTMYLGSEFFGGFSDAAAPWVGINIDGMDEGDDSVDELFANPFEMTFLFGEVEPIDRGLETIDGEQLRHVQIPVSVADMLAGPGGIDDFTDLNDLPGIEELDEVVFDVWVSEDNSIRRISLDLVIAGEPNGFDMWVVISPGPTEIALPEPSEVTDLEELFGTWNTEFENTEFENTRTDVIVED
jgi:hypothetical protein